MHSAFGSSLEGASIVDIIALLLNAPETDTVLLAMTKQPYTYIQTFNPASFVATMAVSYLNKESLTLPPSSPFKE